MRPLELLGALEDFQRRPFEAAHEVERRQLRFEVLDSGGGHHSSQNGL